MDGDSIPRSIILSAGFSDFVGTFLPGFILLFLLIVLGGVFSAAETAYSFCSPVRIRMLADDGNRRAIRVTDILEDFDRTIVTLLIAVNILHIATATTATVLFVDLLHNEAVGSAVATVVSTLLVFFIGETIPKNIACANADSFALLFSPVMRFFLFIFKPLAFLLTAVAEAVKKLFRVHDDEPSLTEDEFAAMVEDAADDGVMEDDETEIIKSVIDFADTTVEQIMMPLDRVCMISSRASDEEIKDILLKEKYSRFPVYRGSGTNIVGVLHSSDTLWHILNGSETFVMKDNMKPAYYVSPDAHIDVVFEGMGRRHSHIAVVRDPKGKALGIVTMEDILEEIVGEIYDEDDPSDGKEAQPS